MVNSFLSSRYMFMGAAIVGVVGAAGMFLYEQLYAEKRRTMLLQEVARLEKQVLSMRTELETLRELQKEIQSRKVKRKVLRQERAKNSAPVQSGDQPDTSYASDSEYFTDYQSVLGTDAELDSEEFFDVQSDDEDTLRETLHNGTAAIDNLSDDETSEKSKASKVAGGAT